MPNNRKWPPMEIILIDRLQEWANLAVPVELGTDMTAQDCLVAMAERRGIQKLISKMREITRVQREEDKNG
ncbi:MAG: hypothetical protein QQN63_05265 [Nitrosopumilus sp.]